MKIVLIQQKSTLIVALRAPSLAKFGEVDTVPVSEEYTKHRGNSNDKYSQIEYRQKYNAIRLARSNYKTSPNQLSASNYMHHKRQNLT